MLFGGFRLDLDTGQVVPDGLGGDLLFNARGDEDGSLAAIPPAKLSTLEKAPLLPSPSPGLPSQGLTVVPADFSGRFRLSVNGQSSARLELAVDPAGTVSGTFQSESSGSVYPVSGKVDPQTPQKLGFSVKFPRSRQDFTGLLWSEGKNVLAGTASMLNREFSFIALREGAKLRLEPDAVAQALNFPPRQDRRRRCPDRVPGRARSVHSERGPVMGRRASPLNAAREPLILNHERSPDESRPTSPRRLSLSPRNRPVFLRRRLGAGVRDRPRDTAPAGALPSRIRRDRVPPGTRGAGRKASLCAIELRSPAPFTFAGFAAFNAEYAKILEDWGLFVDGVNPVARTNVAPELEPPAEPVLYGFSYSRPCGPEHPPTFVVAGAGELPEGILAHESIVRVGETSSDAMAEKATFVLDLMENRLKGLGFDWPQVTAADVYTIHSLDRLVPELVLKRLGSAGVHGIRWFHTRPPIVAIEFEMDLRGVRTELRIG